MTKLLKEGKKCVPIDLAFYIAREVSCALLEMHKKLIIHRDIKSENILVDLDSKRNAGAPVVKLSDFDRSIPLHSLSHACCISHLGSHPPNVCVGTPCWMAPEVLKAMHEKHHYGLVRISFVILDSLFIQNIFCAYLSGNFADICALQLALWDFCYPLVEYTNVSNVALAFNMFMLGINYLAVENITYILCRIYSYFKHYSDHWNYRAFICSWQPVSAYLLDSIAPPKARLTCLIKYFLNAGSRYLVIRMFFVGDAYTWDTIPGAS